MATIFNYPDVLGYITGGTRQQINVMQAALALRGTATPGQSIVRAGRPFEVIALLQNASNAPCDVTATLRLPDADAKRVKGRFITKSTRLVVNVLPAEVGIITLPCVCHPETAPNDTYKLALEVEVKPLAKPERIRAESGGAPFSLERLAPERQPPIERLKPLEFVAGRSGGRIDMTFGVLSPSSAASPPAASMTPGWVSLCKLTDLNDDRVLLHAYGKPLQVEALPVLKRTTLLDALAKATAAKFGAAGMSLEEAEARVIAKLMTTIVEYANPKTTQHGYTAAGKYSITPLLERNPLELESSNPLPHWCRALLKLIAKDARAAPAAPAALVKLLYDDLLRDAIEWGFELVETSTGEDIGSMDERRAYADDLIAALNDKSGVTFNQVYLPLVMAGVLINDGLLMEREDPAELLKGVSHALEARIPSLDENDAPIQEMADVLLERTAQKYGYKLN